MSAKPEAAAVSRLRARTAAQMAEIKSQEEALSAQLLAAIPKSLSRWSGEAGDMLIQDLLKYGFSGQKYRRDEGSTYGYTNLKEFERRFKELRVAWDGIVNIHIAWDGDYRFQVTFTAA